MNEQKTVWMGNIEHTMNEQTIKKIFEKHSKSIYYNKI